MDDINIYESNTETHTIESILNQISLRKADLNPEYQRDVVWTTEKQSNFINSVFTGIIPNPIVFNKDENRNITCIDGKQRCTSLINFVNNIISVTFYNQSYYYSKIPQDYKNNNNVKILSKKYRNIFMDKNIPIVSYKNLLKINELAIFKKLQEGVELSSGEKLLGYIPNKLIRKYKRFCNNEDVIKLICSKYSKDGTNEIITDNYHYINKEINRSYHYAFIAKLYTILYSNYTKNLYFEDYKDFLSTCKDNKELEEKLNTLKQYIDFIFSNKYLNNKKLKKQKFIIVYGLLYLVKEMNLNNINDVKLITAYNKIINEKKLKTHKDVKDRLTYYYNL